MIDNLEYKTDDIKDKDVYNILSNYYQKDYEDALNNGVDIPESKSQANSFKQLEYKAKGQTNFTKVTYLRVVEKDTLLNGTYYLNGNTIIGKVYSK